MYLEESIDEKSLQCHVQKQTLTVLDFQEVHSFQSHGTNELLAIDNWHALVTLLKSKQYKQKVATKSYKIEIKLLANHEQPSPGLQIEQLRG